MVTVVATPEPDGPPIRNEESTTARPAELRRPPMAANEKSMKNLPGARLLQHGAEHGEQDDQAGGHVHRGAEDAFQRHVEVRDEVLERIAPVRPGMRQAMAEHRVEEEGDGHARHDPAGGAPRALQQQHDEDAARRSSRSGSAWWRGRRSRRPATARRAWCRPPPPPADSPTSGCGRGSASPWGTAGSTAPAPCRRGPAAARAPARSRRRRRGGTARRRWRTRRWRGRSSPPSRLNAPSSASTRCSICAWASLLSPAAESDETESALSGLESTRFSLRR